MPKYRVLLHGHNLLVDLDGHVAKHGFYTTRFIEAASPGAAGRHAVEQLERERPLRRLGQNELKDWPWVDADEIVELASFDGIEDLRPGFAYYAEDDE